MTRDDYLKAVGSFEPDDGMKRRVLLGMAAESRHRHHVRRALISVLAAVLVLASLTGVAMAASPEVREAVLRFFRLAETEQVPEATYTRPTRAEIDGRVYAAYLPLTDEEYLEFQRGARFNEAGEVTKFLLYDIEDGRLTVEEREPKRAEFSVTWRGVDYDCTVSWCVDGGELRVIGEGRLPFEDAGWGFSAIPGRTDAVLLYVSKGTQFMSRSYPYLCMLDTGEVVDILDGTGVGELEFPYQYIWSDGLDKLLVTQQNPHRTYYCDVESRTLAPLDELVDGDALWGSFVDEDTVVANTSLPSDTYSAWVLDLNTFEVRQSLKDEPMYEGGGSSGVTPLGGRYCLYTSDEGEVTVLDLVTGEGVSVAGFRNDGAFIANGSKILYYSDDPSADGLGITMLGVLDMDSGEFIAFDRSGYDNLIEATVGWYDDERVIIEALVKGDSTHYMYIYEF